MFDRPVPAKGEGTATAALERDPICVARIARDRPTWGVAKGDDGRLDDHRQLRQWQFGQKDWTSITSDTPAWADQPVGGVAVAQLSPNEFLLVGDYVRLQFGGRAGGPANGMVVRVEEGTFDRGRWKTSRIWNGDQTDYGLNLLDRPVLLKVTMGRYR
ncbi:DUF5597 domain-containing protein [Sphingomonas montana]|uniref:DUF5597 domain-containing protein n=1 Tax=Sphingomonas montana TaxID=1843236 RepID=UPI00101AD144|nr:DUF5597 domain-containing protein [Sphingomonas montana]